MPTLSPLKVTAGQAARIAAALKAEAEGAEAQEKAQAEAAGLPYIPPTDEERFERWLFQSLETTVLNHEQREKIKAALSTQEEF